MTVPLHFKWVIIRVSDNRCQTIASFYGKNVKKGQSARKNMCPLRAAVQLAQEMGPRLGTGALLLKTLSVGRRWATDVTPRVNAAPVPS